MSCIQDLILIGAGGFGREVKWLVDRINDSKPTWNILGFVDDVKFPEQNSVADLPVLGPISILKEKFFDSHVVCCIGNPLSREQILSKGFRQKLATLIDPSVLLSDSVDIGEGTVICAGTICTVNISIGKNVLLNLDCTIGHDVVISDFVTIYPSVNVSGNVNVQRFVEIGTGTQIIQGITIESHSVIGAGSVVVRNIPEGVTAVGCPAKPISKRPV
jgi:sugar O-acyltransferase (sialic acid O-acetyltransferase NeuD family)